jgi:hypothetical protein
MICDDFKLPKLQYKSIDDWLLDGELDRIAREKLKLNGNHLKPPCDCAECVIHGERVQMPEQHNCEYVRERSKLVGIAAAIATEKIGRPCGGEVGARWTAEFVRQMDRLSAPLLNGSHGNDLKADARERNQFQNVEANIGPAVTGPEHQRSKQDEITTVLVTKQGLSTQSPPQASQAEQSPDGAGLS